MRRARRCKLTEREFQAQVVALAKLMGWKVAAFRPAMNRRGRWMTPLQGDPGFPDLVLVRATRPGEPGSAGRLIFAELKVGENKVTAEQRDWLFDLAGVPGVETYCWRPENWDEIERVLGLRRS